MTTHTTTRVPRINVDWTVPIWGIVGLLVQAVAVVWLIASMNAQVQNNTLRLDKMETRVAASDLAVSGMAASLARIDERTRILANTFSQPTPQRPDVP